MPDYIDGLPKCELHVHLEGTLEPGLQRKLAERHGLAPPTRRDGETYGTLARFLADYYEAMDVLRDEDDFTALAAAYLARAHAQGVVYCEMFFDPQAHIGRGVPFDAVVGGIRRAQVEAEASLGVRSELILCFLRDHSVESAWQTLDAARPFKEWIIGVGLDSDERGNPPSKFAAVFGQARQEGFHITVHCDPNQDGSLDHIRECLGIIDTERIDHGVNTLEDEDLCREIASRRIGLTLCPLSNRQIYGDLMGRQMGELLDRGILVTCNSDDPAYFGGYLGDNLRALEASGQIDRAQIIQLVRNGFEVAWLGPAERDAYLSAVDEYVPT